MHIFNWFYALETRTNCPDRVGVTPLFIPTMMVRTFAMLSLIEFVYRIQTTAANNMLTLTTGCGAN